MPTKTPTPQAFVTWLAEEPEVIHSGVAAAFPIVAGLESLGVVEHVLQADDRRDRDVPSGERPVETSRIAARCALVAADGS